MQLEFPLHIYFAGSWLWLQTRVQSKCSLESNLSGQMIFHLLAMCTHDRPLNLWIVRTLRCLLSWNTVRLQQQPGILHPYELTRRLRAHSLVKCRVSCALCWSCFLRRHWCNSGILPVSSEIVSWSSTNFLIATVSNVDLEISSILPLYWDFPHEFHEGPSFTSITAHEEVDDLVDVDLLLDEHGRFLLFVTRSFHSTFEYFSVVPGLEFVFLNLCLTVSENLLSLSLQESPNLFILRIVSLSLLSARHKPAAFFFRMIGSSSARIKERLADGDVIVV